MFRGCAAGLSVVLGIAGAQAVRADVICVDPGGPRAIEGCGAKEETLTLNVANYLTKYLKNAGYSVHQTRTDNTKISETARAQQCNNAGATASISIVANSAESSAATGVDIFHNGKGKAKQLGDAIGSYAAQNMSLRHRSTTETSRYAFLNTLNNAGVKAYIGFIVNCSKDVPAMKKSSEYARSLCRAILSTYNKNTGWCADTGILTVVVTSSSGGSVSGAKAELSHLGNHMSATTDAGGRYAFTLVGGTYSVSASHADYIGASSSCTVAADKNTTCEIRLAPKTGQMHGKVIAADSPQTVIADASLQFSPNVSGWGNDASGWSAIAMPGTYQITATHPKYESASIGCAVASGQNAACGDIAMKLKPGGLSGSVKCQSEHVPATITVDGQKIAYDGQNKWTASNLDAGMYSVTVTPASEAGCQPMTMNCAVVAGNTTDCSVVLSTSPGILKGRVTDAETAESLNAAQISYADGDQTITAPSGSDGSYTYSVGAKTYELTASAEGYASSKKTCAVEAGKTTECDFALTPLPGTICFLVRSESTGAFVSAAIRLMQGETEISSGEALTTDFCFDDIARGKYEAQFEGDFETKTESIEIINGESSAKTVIVKETQTKSLRITGTVISSLNLQTKVKSTLTAESLPDARVSYDGSDVDWAIIVPGDGFYDITATPIDERLYHSGKSSCRHGERCVIVVNPIIESIETEQETGAPAELEIMALDNACSSQPRRPASGGLPMIAACAAAAAIFARRRRAE